MCFSGELNNKNSFETLKVKINTTPILSFPYLQQPFKIEIDSSDYARGAMLIQRRKPICYHYMTFNGVVRDYPTYEKELYYLVQRVKKWKHYLMRKEKIVHIDHQPL
jgi:hypothetical protein